MASPKPKQKPKPKDLTEKSQGERFKETARELGAKGREAFEHAFRVIVPPKHKPKG